MKVDVFHKGKKISIDVKKTNLISKGLGLTFKNRNTDNLIFDFSKNVTWQGTLTSMFVFFPFLTLWVDSKNKVIDFKIVKPFRFSIKQNKQFRKIIEIPINEKNKDLIVRFISAKDYGKFRR